ncbi:hypothetical protein NDN08_002062 [Rhodosorus marinus]|uniref:Uncharacterized protein n=1 Tax=Rhodosorus marinus TaxID=101924 RepID=A0AAV8USM3_9RHOD|nr:hypothetical protein NDN08_002062 [Rhodosorus marinus]
MGTIRFYSVLVLLLVAAAAGGWVDSENHEDVFSSRVQVDSSLRMATGSILITNKKKQLLPKAGIIKLKVNYQVSAPGDIAFYIQEIGINKFLKFKRVKVNRGSGSISLTLQGYGTLTKGKYYRVKTDLLPRGGAFNKPIANDVYIALADPRPIIPKKDSIDIVLKPHSDRISETGPHYVKCDWAATKPSTIIVTMSNKKIVAKVRKKVPRGYGLADIGPLKFKNAKGSYEIKVTIGPRGGNVRDTDRLKVTVRQHDHMVIVSDYTEIPRNGPLKVRLYYVSLVVATGRNLFLELHSSKKLVKRIKAFAPPGVFDKTFTINYKNLNRADLYEIRAVLETKTGLFEDSDSRFVTVK